MKKLCLLLLLTAVTIKVSAGRNENRGIAIMKEMAKPFLNANILDKIGKCMKKCDCIDEVSYIVDMDCSTYDKGNDWIGCLGKCVLEDLGLMVGDQITAKKGTAVGLCLKYLSPNMSTLCAFSGSFDKCWGAKPKKGSALGVGRAAAWAKCCCIQGQLLMEILGY